MQNKVHEAVASGLAVFAPLAARGTPLHDQHSACIVERDPEAYSRAVRCLIAEETARTALVRERCRWTLKRHTISSVSRVSGESSSVETAMSNSTGGKTASLVLDARSAGLGLGIGTFVAELTKTPYALEGRHAHRWLPSAVGLEGPSLIPQDSATRSHPQLARRKPSVTHSSSSLSSCSSGAIRFPRSMTY